MKGVFFPHVLYDEFPTFMQFEQNGWEEFRIECNFYLIYIMDGWS